MPLSFGVGNMVLTVCPRSLDQISIVIYYSISRTDSAIDGNSEIEDPNHRFSGQVSGRIVGRGRSRNSKAPARNVITSANLTA